MNPFVPWIPCWFINHSGIVAWPGAAWGAAWGPARPRFAFGGFPTKKELKIVAGTWNKTILYQQWVTNNYNWTSMIYQQLTENQWFTSNFENQYTNNLSEWP